ncbi:MAG TPA: response regulator transcription factor [Bradyrhizobium sp.]|nr:response regulator transcription factor [Bradyrhizobium sp.]
MRIRDRGEDHMRRKRVVIADRHPVILQGLSRVLGAQHDFKIVAHCGDGASCLDAIRVLVPDIAIIDMLMPGVAALVKFTSENAATRLVLFTSSVEDRDLRTLAAAGVYAVIPTDIEPDALVQILRKVADGQRVLPEPSSPKPAFREESVVADEALTALTDRERQIMRLVSEGLSNKEIGRRLNIADGTIKVHLHNIFQKLEIGNRTALAALAISQNEHAGSSPGSRGAKGRQRRRHHE